MGTRLERVMAKAVSTMRDGDLARAYVDIMRRIDVIYADGEWEHDSDYAELELLLLEEMATRYVKEHVLYD